MGKAAERSLREMLDAESPAGFAHVRAIAAFGFKRALFLMSEAMMEADSDEPAGWKGFGLRRSSARAEAMDRMIEAFLEEPGEEAMERGELEIQRRAGWTREECDLAKRDEELGSKLGLWVFGPFPLEERIAQMLDSSLAKNGVEPWSDTVAAAAEAMRSGADPDDPLRELMGGEPNPEAPALHAAFERARMGKGVGPGAIDSKPAGRARGL